MSYPVQGVPHTGAYSLFYAVGGVDAEAETFGTLRPSGTRQPLNRSVEESQVWTWSC